MNLPKARTKNILVQKAGHELLIYDLKINKAFCLNETAAMVYQICNGETSSDDLKHPLSDDLIFLTLDELNKQNLIANGYQPKFKGASRREAIRRIGMASLMALPIIAVVVAPAAAQARSACSNSFGGTTPPGATAMGFGVNFSIPDAQLKAIADAKVECCSSNINQASNVFDCRPGSPPLFECDLTTTCA